MDPRQLEAFTAVMSTGSVTGAARLLERSQPAITRSVQELEAEIGCTLFTRNGPRVTPTEQGFLLLEDAERALAALRRINERVAEIALGGAQPLVLAATSALAVGLLPQALKHHEARSGSTAPVQLRSDQPEQVIKAVLGGEVQLGLSSLPLEQRGVQVHWIGQLACVAVLAQDDPLAALATVPLAALAQRRLITMSNPNRFRHRLDPVLLAAGRAPGRHHGLIETNSSINAQALVRAGLGVAVLEPLTPAGAPLEGVVVRPLDTDIPFLFGVITLESRPLPPAVQALIESLRLAACELPGFVLHDAADHARLLKNKILPPSPTRPQTAPARSRP